ncbi:hypothetical protein WJX81_004939 [Elliptochloris bilobata]|uniref:3-oxo-5-alpha-steroid 4-dehydrogenase C-terminal domain-containing protein n=1 Tax=Elliptochloris bilobata TaxID=381761 RepID=A0AAW1QI23_9CHLO
MLEVYPAALLSSVPVLLRVYWVLAAGAAVFALLPLNVAPSFRAAVVLSACRGKTWDSKPAARLGPLTGLSVPQSWFAHFYDVGAAVNAAVLGSLLALAANSGSLGSMAADGASDAALAGLALLQAHLTRRLAEANWLACYPAGARMHAIAYLFGLSYYVVLPLSLLPDELWQRLGEGAWPARAPAAPALLARARCAAAAQPPIALLGAAVFLVGNALQLHSHWLLARLRPAQPRKPGPDVSLSEGPAADAGDGDYSVPRGGAFALVSCPHYLAEIVIYAGLAMVAGRARLQPWLVLTWVVANLLLAAGPTHAWYRRRFKDYPASRRAIIPYVY